MERTVSYPRLKPWEDVTSARSGSSLYEQRSDNPATIASWAKTLAVKRDGNPYRLLASWQAVFGQNALADATETVSASAAER